MPAAVVVDSLSKRYGRIEAIRGVSFDVAGGEVFGLLGPNGAGKTTTIECALGLRQADRGSIWIDGIDAAANPNRVKQRIGAQLQATALQDQITPREALELFRSFYERGLGPGELIERFRLSQIADAPFAGLSAGQKQRLAIALAFVNDPAVVFLDEPTSGLDAHSRRDVYAAIESMRADGRTVILTTHYIEEAEQLCARVAIIDRGIIVATGSPRELIAKAKTPPRIQFRAAKAVGGNNLLALAGVLSVEPADGGWRLATRTIGSTTIALVRLLENQQNDLLDLEVHHPTLEDVFIELTGSAIEGREPQTPELTTLPAPPTVAVEMSS